MKLNLFGLFNKEDKGHAIPAPETRSYEVPEKVFIEREGENYFYSFEEPNHHFYNLLDGFYSKQNFIELFYTLPEVFAPVHEIARRVADANWQLCKDWNMK